MMNKEKFVYVTYIAATPEKIWAALLNGELTRQYWLHENVSDSNWEVGSKWQHITADDTHTVRMVGEVLESVPQKRLVMTWLTPDHVDDEDMHTRVTIELETVGEMVKLTVTHDQLYAEMSRWISYGWPLVLSSLKSFLETGTPLDISA